MSNKYEAMQDWAVEREVLTRLGYRLVFYDPKTTLRTLGDPSYGIVDENDIALIKAVGNFDEKPDEAWRICVELLEEDAVTRNLNAAWGLPLGGSTYITLETNGGGGCLAIIWSGGITRIVRAKGYHDTNPARAVCIAWLLYKDARDEH